MIYLYFNEGSSFALFVVICVRLQLSSFSRPKIKDLFARNTWCVQVQDILIFFSGMEADRNVEVVGGDVAVL